MKKGIYLNCNKFNFVLYLAWVLFISYFYFINFHSLLHKETQQLMLFPFSPFSPAKYYNVIKVSLRQTRCGMNSLPILWHCVIISGCGILKYWNEYYGCHRGPFLCHPIVLLIRINVPLHSALYLVSWSSITIKPSE